MIMNLENIHFLIYHYIFQHSDFYGSILNNELSYEIHFIPHYF